MSQHKIVGCRCWRLLDGYASNSMAVFIRRRLGLPAGYGPASYETSRQLVVSADAGFRVMGLLDPNSR
eukprot:m.28284 g.28284  ORF g.28284 m.28284 type:complete len:68 (+) comp11820_c0_seq6:311-514(+)